ncbi:MAG TPA: PilZ domain-containing protein [Pyrinomonadaceae bacterium]|nr:PilZ domain-containing protein [Pyrinomonadaceae bacterium]
MLREVDDDMPELMRSLANRLRVFIGNRRYATRLNTRLPATVALGEQKTGIHRTDAGRLPPLKGYTRDISTTGVGLIMPAIRIGDRYLTGEAQTLTITLDLPTGPIQLRGTVTRYEPLGDDEEEVGYLIGMHITGMTDTDRTHFTQHIRTISKQQRGKG